MLSLTRALAEGYSSLVMLSLLFVFVFSNVIDVTYMEPHSLERSELMGRAREYQ